MVIDKNYKGLVIKKFNEFYLVELKKYENLGSNRKFLCKLRKSVNFKNQLVFVGVQVVLNQIDLKQLCKIDFHKNI